MFTCLLVFICVMLLEYFIRMLGVDKETPRVLHTLSC